MVGIYTFIRIIDDKMTNTCIKAPGELEITDTSWIEHGIMNNMHFIQEYRICRTDVFMVLFLDGRVFYTLPSTDGLHNIEHLCGQDMYIGIWNKQEDILELEWSVKGPHKNYYMKTQYIHQIQ